MKNGKMMIRSSKMMVGGVIFLFALIFIACPTPISPRLPIGGDIVSGGTTEPGGPETVNLTLKTSNNVTSITQGSFTYPDNGTAKDYEIWIETALPEGATSIKWTVTKGGVTVGTPITITDITNKKLPFPTLANSLDSSKGAKEYLAAGSYTIKADVNNAKGETIGSGDKTVSVDPLTYAITVKDSSNNIYPPTAITVTQGNSINQQFTITDNIYDSYFAREYNWSITIGGSTQTGTAVPVASGNNGSGTITVSQAISGTTEPGSYTVTVSGSVTGTGLTPANDTESVTLTINGLGGAITPTPATWEAVSGSLPLAQGAFTYNNGGTPANRALSFDTTAFINSETFQWRIKDNAGGASAEYVDITSATTGSLALIQVKKTPGANPGDSDTYALETTPASYAYLPVGVYSFYAQIWSDDAPPVLLGATDAVTVSVSALPAYAITVTNNDDGGAVISNGGEIEVEESVIQSSFVLSLSVEDNIFDDENIVTRSYTWEVTDGTDTETGATAVTGSGNNGAATIEIDFDTDFDDIDASSLGDGDELTVTISVNTSGATTATKTVIFTITITGP
jgi:hypothetical protein